MAVCAVSNRSLKTVKPEIIITYHGMGGVLICLTYILIEACLSSYQCWDNGLRILSYTGRIYGIALAASVIDNICLYCFTMAYAADSSGFVALISFLRIVWAYIADQVVFHEEFKAS